MQRRISNPLLQKLVKEAGASGERVTVVDATFPDFGIRIGPKAATFFVRYRKGSRRIQQKVGRYPKMSLQDAREEADRILSLVQKGINPKQPRVLTLEDLARRFMDEWSKPRKRSWKEDQRILDRNILPHFGAGTIATDLTRADVRAFNAQMLKRGDAIANNTFAVLSRLYNWANEEELLEMNPCSGVRSPGVRRAGENVLSPGEIRAVWRALESDGGVQATAVQLMMLLGQRPNEIRGAQRGEIAGPWWEIPGSRTKNGIAHRIYLPPTALELMTRDAKWRRRWSGTEHATNLFPSSRTGRAVDRDSQFTRRLYRRTGVKFQLRDLRRTFFTNCLALGVPYRIVQACVNHSDGSVARHNYDRYEFMKEKRSTWERHEEHIRAIAAGRDETAVL